MTRSSITATSRSTSRGPRARSCCARCSPRTLRDPGAGSLAERYDAVVGEPGAARAISGRRIRRGRARRRISARSSAGARARPDRSSAPPRASASAAASSDTAELVPALELELAPGRMVRLVGSTELLLRRGGRATSVIAMVGVAEKSSAPPPARRARPSRARGCRARTRGPRPRAARNPTEPRAAYRTSRGRKPTRASVPCRARARPRRSPARLPPAARCDAPRARSPRAPPTDDRRPGATRSRRSASGPSSAPTASPRHRISPRSRSAGSGPLAEVTHARRPLVRQWRRRMSRPDPRRAPCVAAGRFRRSLRGRRGVGRHRQDVLPRAPGRRPRARGCAARSDPGRHVHRQGGRRASAAHPRPARPARASKRVGNGVDGRRGCRRCLADRRRRTRAPARRGRRVRPRADLHDPRLLLPTARRGRVRRTAPVRADAGRRRGRIRCRVRRAPARAVRSRVTGPRAARRVPRARRHRRSPARPVAHVRTQRQRRAAARRRSPPIAPATSASSCASRSGTDPRPRRTPGADEPRRQRQAPRAEIG